MRCGKASAATTLTVCLIHTLDQPTLSPIPLYWLLLSDIVFGIGAAIALATIIEFVMAQSPHSMRPVVKSKARSPVWSL